MTPDELLSSLKKITAAESHIWTLPIRVCQDDAIAAELIEIAYKRLGDDAKTSRLLNVASTMFWWVILILSLSDDKDMKV